MLFDGGLSAPQDITQGIPQGSPLLVILFILFISTLYEKLKHIKGLITLGFTDDINLQAFTHDTLTCCKILKAAYKICKEWVKEKGITFNLKKSELIYFL